MKVQPNQPQPGVTPDNAVEGSNAPDSSTRSSFSSYLQKPQDAETGDQQGVPAEAESRDAEIERPTTGTLYRQDFKSTLQPPAGGMDQPAGDKSLFGGVPLQRNLAGLNSPPVPVAGQPPQPDSLMMKDAGPGVAAQPFTFQAVSIPPGPGDPLPPGLTRESLAVTPQAQTLEPAPQGPGAGYSGESKRLFADTLSTPADSPTPALAGEKTLNLDSYHEPQQGTQGNATPGEEHFFSRTPGSNPQPSTPASTNLEHASGLTGSGPIGSSGIKEPLPETLTAHDKPPAFLPHRNLKDVIPGQTSGLTSKHTVAGTLARNLASTVTGKPSPDTHEARYVKKPGESHNPEQATLPQSQLSPLETPVVRAVTDQAPAQEVQAMSASAKAQMEALVNELVDKVQVTSTGQADNRIDIQFNSKTLQGLEVSIAHTDGKVTVEFNAASPQISQLLTQNVQQLTDALAMRGLDVADVRVMTPATTSGSSGSGRRSDRDSGRGGRGGGQSGQRGSR